ncbi:3-oxoacyl-[acyl-carrier-protein] synthase III C-terminal domain-containing protein [Streptomyces sp. NRRL F-5053]|uniref:3-oxoacyl-[acyl-carrier-protein] synthase III C-terminal domain-containing protein n=1 Tax=Streptomyces sp. NRRL F-5053 TaxID=1463854 RepID=UPI00068D4032|nr:3-oxoacyl-[acyl-carrier-protein] synthase III C-terminal domain-containing protein [Streptomyces sp. NRRL F-5053]
MTDHRTRTPVPLAVRSAAWYLPEREVPVDELAVRDETERTTRAAMGIETVRADEQLGAVDLCERAARTALDGAGIGADALDALVMVESRAPETLLSSEVTRLQDTLGASRATSFTVGGLGCVSVTPALLAARGLLAADPDVRYVLAVHGSKPAAATRYRHPVTVNGDGGQALLLDRGPGRVRVLDLLQRTDGRYWDLFHVPYRDLPTEQWREECTDAGTYSFRLALETRSRFAALLEELLGRNGLGRADISGYVSHNLSAGSFTFTEESLDIALHPVCRENLRRYGHLGPNDVFLNLYTALERGEFAPGDRVVLLNASPVAAWSLVLVEVGPEVPGGSRGPGEGAR